MDALETGSTPIPLPGPSTPVPTTPVPASPDPASGPDLLDAIVTESRLAQTDTERTRARDLISEFVEQILAGTVTVRKSLTASLDARIAELGRLLSLQVNEVLHHPEFQRLEGSWRGLKYLVGQAETSPTLKVKVLHASKADLVKDFRTSADYDQSALFKKVYEEEYGTFGGAPYAALLGDFEFGRSPEDFHLLEDLSHVAAAAHAPLVTAASPGLFGLDHFGELSRPRNLAKLFDTVEYAKWNAFRASDDARYVGLVLPHVLGRLPYGSDTLPVESFAFEEDTDGSDASRYLWSSAVYAYGARLTSAFAQFGWLAAIRGVEGGGLVEGLPVHTFRTDAGEVALKCPTEVAITDRNEKLLADLGFIGLVHCKNTDYASFFSGQSAQKARTYNTDAANANARLSTQLPYIFAVSRIAHYLKAIMRDKVGSFASRQGVQDYLNTWLAQYVLLDDAASQEAKSKYPLREAHVEVVDVPGRPGCFRAAAFLRPHFQLDELTVSLRLVADLPQSSR
jgi:type VI secretion system protein ImpC